MQIRRQPPGVRRATSNRSFGRPIGGVAEKIVAREIHSLTDIERSRSLGAVRDKMVTPIAMTQKATPATTFWARLTVNRSSKTHTLSTIATAGSTTTISGWDTLNGPTCKAACWSTEPRTPEAINA